jgi:hypothetical protein
MTTQARRGLALDTLHTDPALGVVTHTSADHMIRSRSMLLIHENLAKARIDQRLDEAQLVRQVRVAKIRRARLSRVASAASRARLLVAYGSASR